jgi:hypothetical protein
MRHVVTRHLQNTNFVSPLRQQSVLTNAELEITVKPDFTNNEHWLCIYSVYDMIRHHMIYKVS